jgi:hypothetical protein
VGFAPFYLAWDPTGTRLAYLGNGPAGIELGILDAGTAVTIDRGQPYFVSWSPDGERLLAHVAGTRLDLVGVDGSIEAVSTVAASTFNAPAWSPDGGTLVFAVDTESEQRLVVTDVSGGPSTPLAGFEGRASFVLSPEGNRLAFQSGAVEQPAVAASAGTAIAVPAFARQRVPSPVGLSVIDLAGGGITAVTIDFAAAFFWSPDGRRLLSLHLVDGEDRTWFRWRVWEDGEIFEGPRFLPTRTFASEYLAFFDQYAQSMTPWAPSSDAFVYAGVDEDGIGGIWVQPVADGASPVRVAGGTFASWSP